MKNLGNITLGQLGDAVTASGKPVVIVQNQDGTFNLGVGGHVTSGLSTRELLLTMAEKVVGSSFLRIKKDGTVGEFVPTEKGRGIVRVTDPSRSELYSKLVFSTDEAKEELDMWESGGKAT